MDISSITDIKELKSMAYDQLVQKEITERNLAAINQRIAQLSDQQPEPATTTHEATDDEDIPTSE